MSVFLFLVSVFVSILSEHTCQASLCIFLCICISRFVCILCIFVASILSANQYATLLWKLYLVCACICVCLNTCTYERGPPTHQPGNSMLQRASVQSLKEENTKLRPHCPIAIALHWRGIFSNSLWVVPDVNKYSHTPLAQLAKLWEVKSGQKQGSAHL